MAATVAPGGPPESSLASSRGTCVFPPAAGASTVKLSMRILWLARALWRFEARVLDAADAREAFTSTVVWTTTPAAKRRRWRPAWLN
eukprot:3655020-Rhodomonas_salina.1